MDCLVIITPCDSVSFDKVPHNKNLIVFPTYHHIILSSINRKMTPDVFEYEHYAHIYSRNLLCIIKGYVFVCIQLRRSSVMGVMRGEVFQYA